MAPRRRSSLLVLASALTVLVAAEAAARALEPHLPEPVRWGDATQAVKVAQLDAIAGTEGCRDIVVVGNSMARDGIDPATMASADPDGRTTYNAALDAAGPALVAPWLRDVVLPRARPATVVVAVASFDVSAGNRAARAASEAYASSLGGGRSWADRTERWLTDRSALVEHRASLRHPGQLGAAIGRWRRGEPAGAAEGATAAPVIGPDGEGRSRRDLRHQGPGPASRFAAEHLLADFALDPDALGALGDLLEDLRAGGTEAVVLLLPVTDDFRALHPGGAPQVAAARQAVDGVATAKGVPIVDLLAAPWPDERFADTHHLNGDGARALSAQLPDLLRAAGATLPACRR